MKAHLTKSPDHFRIDLVAETAQDAAALVDFAMNRSARPVDILVATTDTTIEAEITYRQRDDRRIVPHLSELKAAFR